MHSRYLIPSETHLWRQVLLALETGQIDEAVWNRQRPAWVQELFEMSEDKALPVAAPQQEVILPGGVRFKPEG